MNPLHIKQSKRVMIWKNSPRNIQNFVNALNSVNWNDLLRSDDHSIDDSYNIFLEKFSDLQSFHMPTISVKNNKYRTPRSDWITTGIMNSIKYRDKLYIKLKKTKMTNPFYNSRYNELREYNRILRNNINSAKKMFYDCEFRKYRDNMKQTWRVINDILGQKNKSKFFLTL